MKLQTAIEFLSVYGFVIVILATAILIAYFFAASDKPDISSQCVSFGSINCNSVGYYSNTGNTFTLLSITNAQNSPINITNVTVSIAAKNYIGICSPGLLYPGEESTCIANTSKGGSIDAPISGFFTLNVKICGAGLSAPLTSCNQTVAYGGSIYTYSLPLATAIFSVVAAVGNSTSQLAAYNSVPQVPVGYSIVQYGDWEANQNSTAIAYSIGTTAFGGNNFGINTATYPSVLYYLANNAVQCSSPFNSTFSLGYTGMYLSQNTPVTFNAYATNAMAVFYKQQGANSWTSVFTNTLWPLTLPPTYHSTTATLSNGLYSVAVEWSDECGAGVQALEISGNVI